MLPWRMCCSAMMSSSSATFHLSSPTLSLSLVGLTQKDPTTMQKINIWVILGRTTIRLQLDFKAKSTKGKFERPTISIVSLSNLSQRWQVIPLKTITFMFVFQQSSKAMQLTYMERMWWLEMTFFWSARSHPSSLTFCLSPVGSAARARKFLQTRTIILVIFAGRPTFALALDCKQALHHHRPVSTTKCIFVFEALDEILTTIPFQ